MIIFRLQNQHCVHLWRLSWQTKQTFHRLLLVTTFIFCNNPKPMEKSYWVLVEARFNQTQSKPTLNQRTWPEYEVTRNELQCPNQEQHDQQQQMEKSEFLSSVVTPTSIWFLFKLLVQLLEDYKESIKPQMEVEQTWLPNDRRLKTLHLFEQNHQNLWIRKNINRV